MREYPPPGSFYRGPHHGFCKSMITLRQYLPRVTPHLLALFTVGHITVSWNELGWSGDL